MTYEEAARLKPGDVIEWGDPFGNSLGESEVTGQVHPFFDRGHVVYVPIEGRMVVNTHILRKVNGG